MEKRLPLYKFLPFYVGLYVCPICKREKHLKKRPDMRVYCECGNYMEERKK